MNALAQNFNSVGIGFGSMITFASYNKFENRTILLDTMVVILANLLTSVFAGIIVFATLGNISTELGRDIQKVVVDGAYPRRFSSSNLFVQCNLYLHLNFYVNLLKRSMVFSWVLYLYCI